LFILDVKKKRPHILSFFSSLLFSILFLEQMFERGRKYLKTLGQFIGPGFMVAVG
jgi:hypothetical protein